MIAGSGAALAGAVLTCGTFTVLTARNSVSVLNTFTQRDQALQRVVANLKSGFYNYDDQNNMYVLVAATAPKQRQLWQDTYDQAVQASAKFQADLRTAAGLAADQKTRDLIDRIQRDKTGYDAFFVQGHDAVLAGQVTRAAYEETVGNLQPSNDMMPALDELGTQADGAAAASLARLRSAQATVMLAAVVTMVVVATMAGLLVGWFYRSVLSPLAQLRTRMRAIASGEADLTQRIDSTRNDELGELASSFDRFVGNIQVLVGRCAEVAQVLSGSAADLSRVGDDLTTGASDASDRAASGSATADQVTESIAAVRSGTDMMSAAIAEIANSARQAAEVSQESLRLAQATTTKITELGVASGEISVVADLITRIASQTNLLALNATIEASRAGDAGRGFAVVASEVKDLARETTTAAEDIARRIAALQGSSAAAADGVGRIREIIAQIDEFSSTIAAAVEEQAATTGEISTAVGGAAQASFKVSEAFGAVADVTATTSASALTSQHAAHDMSQAVTSLTTLVGNFRY
ncbi:MAG: methyl-accepting chemotaxis protein [Actinobacteria bacterium]|nr:methyl-accepting chemotaxis protein [Actinomycetota bacterium]